MNSLIRTANKVMAIIEEIGYEAYIVGGTPRDILLGKETSDVDIATNCPVSTLHNLFVTYEIGQSAKFGIIGIYVEGAFFEVANYRIDGTYDDGARPSSVEIAPSLKEDVARRDFTINSLAMDKEGRITDYVGGLKDIEAKVIRAVGNPTDRFTEDPVRMVRAARFASRLNFSIEYKTRSAIRHMAKNIAKVTQERLHGEIRKAASGDSEAFARFVEILNDLRLLPKILPEVDTLKYLEHNRDFHPEGRTVYEHTIASVRCVRDNFIDAHLARIATLFHDLGKTVTLITEGSLPKYHGHAEAGVSIINELCKRLKFSSAETDAIVYAAKYHMVYRDAHEMKPAKVARLFSSPYFAILVEVCRADDKSRGELYYVEKEFEEQYKRLEEIKHRWENFLGSKPERLVSGKRIMELLSLDPGRIIGEIKKKVEDRIINESLDFNNSAKVDSLIREEADQLLEEV